MKYYIRLRGRNGLFFVDTGSYSTPHKNDGRIFYDKYKCHNEIENQRKYYNWRRSTLSLWEEKE